MILAGAIGFTAAVELLAHYRQLSLLSVEDKAQFKARARVLRLHASKVVLDCMIAQITLISPTTVLFFPGTASVTGLISAMAQCHRCDGC